jgi:hypothetical protein
MQMDSTPAAQFSSEACSMVVEPLIPERLKVLRELETSLNGSRRALLALDLAGIEQGTREQIGLVRELRRFPERAVKVKMIRRGREKLSGLEVEAQETGGNETVPWPREAAEEIRRSELAVLQAARVQAALLARAQRKLRILANMLAGPTLNYGSLFAKPTYAPAPNATAVYGTRDGEL